VAVVVGLLPLAAAPEVFALALAYLSLLALITLLPLVVAVQAQHLKRAVVLAPIPCLVRLPQQVAVAAALTTIQAHLLHLCTTALMVVLVVAVLQPQI
jgi:hypothetical protein